MSWMSDIFRLLGFLIRWSRSLPGAKAMVIVLLLAGAVSGLANAAFLAIITSVLRDPSQASRFLFWSFVALCMLLPASRFVSGALLLRLAGRTGSELRILLGRKILAAPLRKLEELGAHRLLATMTEDIPNITGAVVSYPNLFMQIFIVLGCLAYLAWLSWPALIGVMGFMTLGIFTHQLPVMAANRLLASGREDWDLLAKSIRGLIEGTKELKLHQGRRREFFSGSFEPVVRSVEHKIVVGRSILHAAACWGHVLFFIVIGLMLFVGPSFQELDSSVLVGFTLLILYMMTPIESILSALPELSSAAVSVKKIESLGVSLEADLELADSELLALRRPDGDWQSLELLGVTHTYRVENTDESFRLGPIHLRLAPGELLFLTGGNGSGKTTLAKILCGLYLPEQGEIRFGGEVVTEERREDFRQHFSAVFSDVFIFESLRGLDGDDGDDGEIDTLAEEYLRKLRLDRVVSVRDGIFSRVEVSQGQKKRLALLTAYVEDRPIYLFDEWAADQDVTFKAFFYRQLLPELRARGKTVIVISHDDHYYDVADRIVKLDYGQIESETIPGTETRPRAGA